MKRNIFFLFTVLVSVPALAQSYHPMLGDSNSWYVKVEIDGYRAYGGITTFDYSSKYYTLGDSIVGGKPYKKFFVDDPYSTYSLSPVGFVGLIREDTTARRVYFWGKDSAHEMLVYDFSLNQGDTMFIRMTPPPPQIAKQYITIWLGSFKYEASVSTVSMPEGSQKQIVLTAPGGPDGFSYYHKALDWVESLGSLKSPLYFYEPLCGIYRVLGSPAPEVNELVSLKCAFRNGIQIYGGGACSFDSTRITAGTGHPVAAGNLVLQHLLCTRNFCRFQCNGMGNNDILEIYDIDGRKMQSFILTPQATGAYNCEFDVPLSAGVYIIKLQSGTRQFSSKAVIE